MVTLIIPPPQNTPFREETLYPGGMTDQTLAFLIASCDSVGFVLTASQTTVASALVSVTGRVLVPGVMHQCGLWF